MQYCVLQCGKCITVQLNAQSDHHTSVLLPLPMAKEYDSVTPLLWVYGTNKRKTTKKRKGFLILFVHVPMKLEILNISMIGNNPCSKSPGLVCADILIVFHFVS